jgi:hypothetical protein
MLNRSSARTFLTGLLLATAGAAGLMTTSCGSSSSSEIVDLCNQTCTKTGMCFADAGASSEVVTQCKQQCTNMTGSNGQSCTNQAQIISAVRSCVAMSNCDAFLSCLESVPDCQGGGGGGLGGASGGGLGGASGGGLGGASGGGSCASCDKAGTCCAALAALTGQPSAACASYSTASCNGMAAAQQSQFAMACDTLLSTGAQLSASCR